MAKLTDFRLLSFDVYGTLIDHERGKLEALRPTLEKNNKTDLDPKLILKKCHDLEGAQQAKTPSMIYSELLETIHPELCESIGCAKPSIEESKAYGDSIGTWPAFPDTVEALKRLQKQYKLVVLSNVDNTSFSASNAGALENFKFDAVLTAQDIGSYKPDLRNFEHMLKHAKDKFGIERTEVLQTAQSQFHDHHPARKMGLKSTWIYRPGSIMGNRDDPVWDWKFDTLADMADAVEREVE